MATFNDANANLFRPSRPMAARLALIVLGILLVGGSVFVTGITMALVAALALGVLALMVAGPEVATMIVVFALYTNLAPVLTRYHRVPEIVAASFFLLLGIPLVIYVLVRKELVITNRVLYVMLAFSGTMLISTFFSQYPIESLIRTARYLLEGVILYFLVLNTVRTQATLRKVIWVVILAGAFLSALSCYQGLTGNYTSTFGGLAQPSGTVGTGEEGWGGQQVIDQGTGGPLGEKNHFAQILVMVLPLALSRFWTERSRILRWLALALCLPVLGGIIYSYSRGAFVSIFVMMLLMVALGRLKVRHLILVGAGGALIVFLAFPDYAYRISTLSGLTAPQRADSSLQGHATVNLAVIHIFLDHPIVGVGPGQSDMYTQAYSNAMGEALRRINVNMSAQNTYLQQMADQGIIGFAVFMTILWIALRQIWRARRAHLEDNPYAAVTLTCLLLAVLSYLTQGLFVDLAWERYFWLILAVSAVAARLAFEEPTDPSGLPVSISNSLSR